MSSRRWMLAGPIAAALLCVGCSDSPKADNTQRNERDRSMSAVTPLSQGNGKADLETTQTIRRAILQLDGLSVDAQNIKIITGEGVITLRGPVVTDAERQAVLAAAQTAAGSNRVQNELEVVH